MKVRSCCGNKINVMSYKSKYKRIFALYILMRLS